MRYYGFGNYYLSSLQQGLQAAHVIADLAVVSHAHTSLKYDDDIRAQAATFFDWADNHKTIVLLNGGNSEDLNELFEFFISGEVAGENNFPSLKFHEDEISLNHALTSVGIVLPPYIYETAAIDRRMRGTLWVDKEGRHGWADVDGVKVQRPCDLNEWEEELIVRLNQYGLAK